MKLKSDEKRTLAAAVVVLLVGVIGGGAPYAWRHAVLRDRIDQAERQLGFDRQRERNLTHLASEVAAMQEMVRGSQKYVPAEPEVASFLRMLSEELAAVGVSAELKQRDRVEGRDFTIVPVDVEFEGGFGAAQRFIARTESMPRLLRFDRLVLERRREDLSVPLSVRLEMTTFAAARVEGEGSS